MNQDTFLAELQSKKERILRQMSELGDLRQGSLSPRYRTCGKPYCHCAKEGSKGHGPLWMVTRAVQGKTVSKTIPREKVDTTFKQIDAFHHFQELVHEYVETSIEICDLKLREEKNSSAEGGKKGSGRTSKRR